jgi:hypothetical protein
MFPLETKGELLVPLLMIEYSKVHSTLLDGSNVRLNRNIESEMNVNWIKFKNCLSLY